MPLAEQIELACLLEATAPKLGNVHPGAAFHDASYADFVTAARVISGPLSQTRQIGVGRAIHDAVQATRDSVGTNVNLGIVLLLAPLAAVPEDVPLRDGIWPVLRSTTVQDAEHVFEAIRLAKPGGLGDAPSQDVRARPTITLLEAMQLAANRDAIAEQYALGFLYVLKRCQKMLLEGLRVAECRDLSGVERILGATCYLQRSILTERLDTLIQRKCGLEAAEEVRYRFIDHFPDSARTPLLDEAPMPLDLIQLDRWLREENHRRNPGATADLIAATLFIALREGTIAPPSCDETTRVAEKVRLYFEHHA